MGPLAMVLPAGSGIAGVGPTWHPVLRPAPQAPAETGQLLADAADAARAGRRDRVTPLLARFAESNDVEVLTADVGVEGQLHAQP